METKKIEELAKILKQNHLTKLDLTEGDTRLVLEAMDCKKTAVPTQNIIVEDVFTEDVIVQAAQEQTIEAAKALDLHEVKAPLVGTAYLTPQAGADPFVKVGDKVSVGDPVCIVESMKMFNTIESDASGIVEEIAVESGQIVEYGQALVRIRKED